VCAEQDGIIRGNTSGVTVYQYNTTTVFGFPAPRLKNRAAGGVCCTVHDWPQRDEGSPRKLSIPFLFIAATIGRRLTGSPVRPSIIDTVEYSK
jgi:hypothetical protein